MSPSLPPRVYLPVNTPAANGAQPTVVIPKWAAIGSKSRSGVRCSRLYSICNPTKALQPRSSAVTLAALTTQAGVSLTPTYSTLPARTKSSRARIVSW